MISFESIKPLISIFVYGTLLIGIITEIIIFRRWISRIYRYITRQ